MRQLLPLIAVVLTMWIGPVAAEEPPVVFEDTFDGKLAEGWTWLREQPDTWRMKNDALEICVQPGVAHNVKNALLRKAPDRSANKYAIEITITFTTPPTQQFEQAGITWYCDEKPVFKLVHEHIDGKDWIIPGRKPAPHKTVQLRLIVDGNKWEAQFREEAKGDYQTAATGELPAPANDQVSIQCYNGPDEGEHWIRFDDFRIIQLER